MKTPPIGRQGDAEDMRRWHYEQSAIDGVLFIRTLDDEPLLDAARSDQSGSHRMIHAHMGAATNPAWISSQCATEAYERGIIDEREFDYLMD